MKNLISMLLSRAGAEDKTASCVTVCIDGHGFAVTAEVFAKMREGREYLHTYRIDGAQVVVRKHDGQLIGRKLETFYALSELE